MVDIKNPADVENVRAAIERPLTGDEERVIPSWLGTAWRKLQTAVPGLTARMSMSPTLPDGSANPAYLDTERVRDAVVEVVERKLRNPDMLRTWNGDTAGFTVDAEASAGKLYVTQQQIDELAVPGSVGGNGMYSIPLGML